MTGGSDGQASITRRNERVLSIVRSLLRILFEGNEIRGVYAVFNLRKTYLQSFITITEETGGGKRLGTAEEGGHV